MVGLKCRKLKLRKDDLIRMHPFDYHTDFSVERKDGTWCNVNHLFKKEITTRGIYNSIKPLDKFKVFYRRHSRGKHLTYPTIKEYKRGVRRKIGIQLEKIPKKYKR